MVGNDGGYSYKKGDGEDSVVSFNHQGRVVRYNREEGRGTGSFKDVDFVVQVNWMSFGSNYEDNM